MSPALPTHVLFDFFGTLVAYSDSRTEQGFHGTYRLVRDLGGELPYDGFLDLLTRTFAAFDQVSDVDDAEFSMTDLGAALLTEVLGACPPAAEVEAFATRYVEEWSAGVRHLPGIRGLVAGLAADHRLAVVTNTYWAPLVPAQLRAMGLHGYFDAVVTSVEVGWRKPHPRIFEAALLTLGAEPSAAVFVGDSLLPDYQGPRAAGIRAYLIDPARRAPVPEHHRLDSVFDLPARLNGAALRVAAPRSA